MSDLDYSKLSSEQIEQQIKLTSRLLAISDAGSDLLAFTQLMMPHPADPEDATKTRYQVASHHRLIAEALEKVERGEILRLAISIPPRHGKSELATRHFPAWFLGKDPYRQCIIAGYSETFAESEFGAKIKRIIELPAFQQVFPGATLRGGSRSVKNLVFAEGGNIASVGRGGAITGRGADLLLIDDPLKDRMEADSALIREQLWDWYTSTAYTRLMPGGRVVVIQCMTGDTPVTMADGSYRRLEEVRPGDVVAAWKDGRLVHRRVLNWTPQGEDDVFDVRAGNARVRANARHPFLVQRADGSQEWVRVRDLKPGDRLVMSAKDERPEGRLTEREAWLLGYMFGDGWVTVRDAKNYDRGRGKFYPRRGYVTCVAQSAYPEENARVAEHFFDLLGVTPKVTAYGYSRTDVARVGRWFTERGLTGTAKTKRLPKYLFSEPVAVRKAFLDGFNNADGAVLGKGRAKGRWTFGSVNEDLIRDVRHLARSCGIAVSNVSVYTAEIKAPNSPAPVISQNVNVQWNPWSEIDAPFRTTRLTSVKPAGREMVYDIQVEDAECFLADGLVTHNTRWHEDDLIGRLCDPNHPNYDAERASEWVYLNVPAVFESEDHLVAQALGKKVGDALWPERYGAPFLESVKRQSKRDFYALYQGRPYPDDGDYFKSEWLVEYDASELPKNLRVYAASDHALSEKTENDATVIGAFGVDENDDIWILPDVVWDRMETDRTVEEILGLMQRRKPLLWFMESENIAKSFGPFLRKRMQETRTYVTIQPMIPSRDKKVRARSIQGRMSMKKVRFPKFAPWWGAAKAELLKFPNGTHDDFVDFCSWIGLGMDQEVSAESPRREGNVIKVGTFAWLKAASERQRRSEQRRKQLAGW